MVLRWPERNKEAEIRVVGQIGSDSGAARIVFVQELPEQNLFRYGAQYLSSDRPRGAF